MIVADASVLIEFHLGGSATPAGHEIARRLTGTDAEAIAAPHLVDAEVGQALRRLVLRGDVEAGAAQQMLADHARLGVVRYQHDVVSLLGAFDRRDNVSFYDATYVALAERLDVALVTADEKLANAPGLGVEVRFAAGGA